LDDNTNIIEKVIKNTLPHHPIDYLKRALTFEWANNKLCKINFKELDTE